MNINTVSAQLDEIKSELVCFPSRNGLKISAYVDSLKNQQEALGYVIMAPKYGETKKNNLQLAYYLAANGLVVLRFDHTNHVGESQGDQTAFTLPGGVDDILGSLDFMDRQNGGHGVTLIASSLSARTAIRATALDERIVHLVCLVGVVNVQHTLREVYQEDLVHNHLSGKKWGITDILGVEIDFDRFLSAAVKSNMHDLSGTRSDILGIRSHITFFPAERDVWVLLTDVRSVCGDLETIQIHPIEGAMHEVRENPDAAEKAFRDMVAVCVGKTFGRMGGSTELKMPDKKQIFKQNKIERDQFKKARPAAEPEREFWSKYLEKYQMLERVEDYRGYLDTVGKMLGPIEESEIVLDAGCGNGLLGVWLIRDILARSRASWIIPPVYIGLDLTRDGLYDALDRHASIARRFLMNSQGSGKTVPGLIYNQVDLDVWAGSPEGGELVTFDDHCFDKICCSLVLSYLKNPFELIKELYRVMKPGGKLVISSMKPFCDMSVIYRDFMGQQVTGEELDSGRNLLRAAGAIKIKEEQGYYVFYSAEELAELVSKAGFINTRWENCFGNQAVAVTAEK